MADAEQDALVRGAAAEPVLRDQAVHDHERAVGEREPVDRCRPEAQRAVLAQDERQPEREQCLLPGRDDLERAAADPGRVQLGHREVVHREADDEDVQDPDGASHAGPAATSVIPRLTILTG
jgi:hypothetical protein